MIAAHTLLELVEHEDRPELRDELAHTLESRGNARRAMENLEDALADHSAASDAYASLVAGGKRPELLPSQAATLLSRGGVYQRCGRLEEAHADYLAAEQIYRRLVRDHHRTELRSRLALALASRGSLQIAWAEQAQDAGDTRAKARAIDAARGIVDEALAEARDMLDVDWELAWKVNDGFGDIWRLTGDLVKALMYEQRAVGVLEAVRRRQGSTLERSVFLTGKADAYLDTADLSLTLAQRTDDDRERAEYAEQAYGAILKLKARDLTEALDEEPLAARLARSPEDAQQELAGLFAEADALRGFLFRQDAAGAVGARVGRPNAPGRLDP
jgi:tetratricopeptide (TPR) repeat protein